MRPRDFTNLEEAWDAYPASVLPDPASAFEVTFYAGAMAALWLVSQGRTLRTLDGEIGDWIACHRERFNATRN